ncbi:SusC/RagA family TonB-linked outer membrane protein [Niabella ginsengisoli]|uniref:TonB-dependent receptor n=1 Tax=Niabella ginsengisoli TaxID=522298 RepID=A0ABS9SHE1_9BACT|nr:TonB-dependent receptor [Niabella ginsengisoli]MCH5597788.1 TonB-dependent receptor [Niabella ginsengisoli]
MLLLLCCSINAMAQNRPVTGRILDKFTGQSLGNATILVKGTNQNIPVAEDGSFSLNVNDTATVLVISYVGYGTQEISVGSQTELTILLSNSEASLDDVVVIGYGAVKKRDLTGSVVSIKGGEATKVPVSSPIEALQGKIPGADIYRNNGYAGGTPNIRIRGTRSIGNPNSSNNVLYIIDGIQYANMADINPNDIQSIEVLKDGSSTAIYGSRGANGVIIITTKKGASGKPKISVNSYAGITERTNYGKAQNAEQFIAFRREAYRADGRWNSPADDATAFTTRELEAINNQQYIDWMDLIFHQGLQQDHQVSVSAGGEKTKIYFSGGYFDEKGVLKNDRFKRYSTRLNVDQKLTDWLTAGTNLSFAHIDNDIRRDPFNLAFKALPLGVPYDSVGNVVSLPVGGTERSPLLDDQPGEWYQNRKTNRFSGALYLDIHPFKDFTWRSTFSTVQESSILGNFYGKNSINGGGANSQSSITNNQVSNINWENVLTYKKSIADHDLTVTGVTAYQQNISTIQSMSGRNQLFPGQLTWNMAAANQNMAMSSNYSRWNLLSFAGRINYSYKGKYLATVTGRTDGSSKLAPGNQWGFFPSAAVAWRISDENFMQSQKIFDDLKLRVSYGVSGNDVVPPYGTQSNLSVVQFAYGDVLASSYVINPLIANPDLRWERTKTIDLGLDFTLLKNRLSGAVDYYNALTYDLITENVLPTSTGVSTINMNFGQTRNQGIEVSLTGNIIQGPDFKWSSTLSYAKNRERIISLPNGNVYASDYRRSFIIGESPTIFYDYVKLGIWQSNEEAEAAKYGDRPGDIKVADLNNDGKITPDADRTIIGTAVPKWSGGLNNDFSFKGFDLNVLLTARIGQWMTSDYFAKYYRNASQNGAVFDYWTPENPTNAYPRPSVARSLKYITTLTEADNSYMKLRNVTLGYNFSKSFLNKYKVDNVRLYVSGKNLWYWSKASKEVDPESEGIVDQPLNKLVVVGLNVSF